MRFQTKIKDELHPPAAVKVLTRTEMRQVERWARKTQIAKMLSFFDALPRFVHIPRPMLLGSNNDDEILVEGDATTSGIRQKLANLDEPFKPYLKRQKIGSGEKRNEPTGALPSVYQQLTNGFPELCLLRGSGDCGQKIASSHSIQKALFKMHAKSGHVYRFEPFTRKRDAEERLWPKLIGVNEASTFTGLCNTHDSAVFSSIDNSQFQNTDGHKFLYHYRVFVHGYYARAHQFKVIENTYHALSQRLPAVELQALARHIEVNHHDVAELDSHRRRYEVALREKRWDAVEGYAFEGDIMPELLAAEFVPPRKGFDGQYIQDCKSTAPLGWISVTITVSDRRALILFCGDKGCPILRKMVESFRKLAVPLRTSSLVSYAFCLFENIILLPSWWESLPGAAQLKFVNAHEGHYYPRDLPVCCDWKLTECAGSS